MSKQKLSSEQIKEIFFLHEDNTNNPEIANITGVSINNVSTTNHRIKAYLKQYAADPSSIENLSTTYKTAIKAIAKEKQLREKIDKVSQIKNNLFKDLGEIIDGLVQQMVEEKYKEILEENQTLKEEVEFITIQFRNQKIIADKYQKDFVKGS